MAMLTVNGEPLPHGPKPESSEVRELVKIKMLEERSKVAAELVWIGTCKGQTEPNFNPCKICNSSKHYAFECQFNGFRNFIKELNL